jgi:hypothetical protein
MTLKRSPFFSLAWLITNGCGVEDDRGKQKPDSATHSHILWPTMDLLVPLYRNSCRRYIGQIRHHSTKNSPPPRTGKDRFNYNESPLLSFLDDSQALADYPRRTANELASNRVPPRRVKMLARDFIHDSLYNPHYGYFAQNAVIFSSDAAFDFNRINNLAHFQEEVAQRYAILGGGSSPTSGLGKQVWHTPTELFKARPPSSLILSALMMISLAVVRPSHCAVFSSRVS